MFRPYKSLMSLHSEYYAQFSLSSYRMDVIQLDRLLKIFAKMLPGLVLSYKERLDRIRH